MYTNSTDYVESLYLAKLPCRNEATCCPPLTQTIYDVSLLSFAEQRIKSNYLSYVVTTAPAADGIKNDSRPRYYLKSTCGLENC